MAIPIYELSDRLDCSFIHGDGSSPDVLREVGPEHTDHLICLPNSDPDNIIASSVGRSPGFKNVIPKVENDACEQGCGTEGTVGRACRGHQQLTTAVRPPPGTRIPARLGDR